MPLEQLKATNAQRGGRTVSGGVGSAAGGAGRVRKAAAGRGRGPERSIHLDALVGPRLYLARDPRRVVLLRGQPARQLGKICALAPHALRSSRRPVKEDLHAFAIRDEGRADRGGGGGGTDAELDAVMSKGLEVPWRANEPDQTEQTHKVIVAHRCRGCSCRRTRPRIPTRSCHPEPQRSCGIWARCRRSRIQTPGHRRRSGSVGAGAS